MQEPIFETTFAAGAHDEGLRLRMRSEERRIHDQHEKLDVLCREVYVQIGKGEREGGIGAFATFAAALDAHMTVEEEIHFPALHGLRPDAAEELDALVAQHDALRLEVARVATYLDRGKDTDARLALERLARAVSRHERDEEDLLTRVNEGPLFATRAAL